MLSAQDVADFFEALREWLVDLEDALEKGERYEVHAAEYHAAALRDVFHHVAEEESH